MHPRQAIIDAIIALLTGISGLATPKEQDEMPAPGANQPVVRVYFAGEASSRITDLEEQRRMRAEVRISVNRAAGFQITLNTLSKKVEDKLIANQRLSNTADSSELLSVTPDYSDVSAIDAASLVLVYEIAYVYTPTITADAFLTAHIEIDMAGPRNDPQSPTEPDGQIDASATVTLPT